MKQFGVKELMQLAGVSARTLHYYDKIGLLKPLERTEAGYRFYGETELLRLQQILFYKELDFSLQEIKELLDDPTFDLVKALQNHKTALQARQRRIATLLETIDHTIHHLKTEKIMDKPEMLYEGLPKEVGTTYRKGAMDKYGKDAVEHSEKELMKLGKEGFVSLQRDFEQVNTALFVLKNEAPESAEVQRLIAHHYQIIRQFWGTSNKADKQVDAYAGLGQLYLHDERYTMQSGKAQPEFAQFLAKAMGYFAKMNLK